MRLAKVYRMNTHSLKRFCMHETVYRSNAILIISVVSVKEFNTLYAGNSGLIKKGSLDT